MTLPEYKNVVADFLARQIPPVVLADDDSIWVVVRVAHGQGRGVIWTAALALAIFQSYEKTDDHEILQVE